MKKLLSVLMVAIIGFGMLNIYNIGAVASTYSERESNDSYASADVISVGDSIKGKISAYDDDDYYKIVASSNGKLSLTFKHKYSSPNSWWYIDVYYCSDGKYNKLNTTYVYLHSDESVKLIDIGAVAGGVYYVMVSHASGTDIYGYEYTISTAFTSSSYYEKEMNDSFQTSTAMSLGNTYTGFLHSMSDKDYYKFTPSSSGTIKLYFNHKYNSANSWWRVRIFDYSNNSYNELSSSYVYLHSSEKFLLPSINVKSDRTYYVLVEYASGTPIVGYEYSLSVGSLESTATSDISISLSTSSITLNKGSSGTINCSYSGSHPNEWVFSYSISNSSIATASWGSWSGKSVPLTVSGESAGSTTIKISVKEKATEKIIVSKNVSVVVVDNSSNSVYLSLSKNSVSVNKGSSVEVNCGVVGQRENLQLAYSISDETIVSASWGEWSGGCPLKIKGLNSGSTKITIYLKDSKTGEVLDKETISVTVVSGTPSMEVAKKSLSIEKDGVTSVKCEVTKSSESDSLRLTFDCSAYESIISVKWVGSWDNGGTLEIKGLESGTAVIKVQLVDRNTGNVIDSDTITVTVEEDATDSGDDFNIFNFLFGWIIVLFNIIASLF